MTNIISKNTRKKANNVELLAPAGNMEKLQTAIHFGANAVYLAGKRYGLRAYADNFDDGEIERAVGYAHERNVKVYVTLNIFASKRRFRRFDRLSCRFGARQGGRGVSVRSRRVRFRQVAFVLAYTYIHSG